MTGSSQAVSLPAEFRFSGDEVFIEREGDAVIIRPKSLGDIARAKGMTQVARDAGLSRESLYKALSGEHSPGFDPILKVLGALGI
jgi:probable addiction module antidote protein